ncbi:MAG: hypothetical protein AMXMBFR12_06130 [Candidatus Babeliales bacterium]
MRHILILLLMSSLRLHSMIDKHTIRDYTALEKFSMGLKEFKHQIKENPKTFSLAGFVYATIPVLAYQIHPWACIAAMSICHTPLLCVLPDMTVSEAQKRIRQYSLKTFSAVQKEEFGKVTEFASRNCYGETDAHALEEQNTHFLFEALLKYEFCCRDSKKQEADNYSKAAEIFLHHHANLQNRSAILTAECTHALT